MRPGNAAISASAEATSAPPGSSFAVASNWIRMAIDCRKAGGHRQIVPARTWPIVCERIDGAAWRGVRAGYTVAGAGRNGFHCAQTIADIRRFDNGQVSAPDRRGAQLSVGVGPRPAVPGASGNSYWAAFRRRRLCLARKLRPRRLASLRMRSSQLAPARFLFSAKNGSNAPATSRTLLSLEISGQ